MSALPTKPEAPDEFDKLFADFFKAQLKHPWPNAPIPAAGAASPATEPSGLVATRTETPRSSPTPAPHAKGRDNTARARFTLAASVALALGACWALTNNFEPGTQPDGTPNPSGILQDGGADFKNHEIRKGIQKTKVDEGTPTTVPGGIKIDKIGDGQ